MEFKFDKAQLRIAVFAVATGFFLGGVFFGGSPETRQVTEFLEVVKRVEVIKEVATKKTATSKEAIKADRAKIVEKRYADGRVILESRYYGLGIDKSSSVSKKRASTTKVTTEDSVRKETTVTVSPRLNLVEFGYLLRYSDVLSFDYKTDWTIRYSRFLPNTPFYGTIQAGPKYFGLGIGFSF